MKLTTTLYEAMALGATQLGGIAPMYTHAMTYEYKKWLINGKTDWLGLDIVIGGKSGSGKSSFVNNLIWKSLFHTDDVEACTRDAQSVFLFEGSLPTGQKASLNSGLKGIMLTDLPGIAESTYRRHEYENLHHVWLENSYRFIYLIKADDRSMEVDEEFLASAPRYIKDKLLIGISQSDRIEPCRQWRYVGDSRGEPSYEQSMNLKRKVHDVASRFCVDPYFVHPFSADGNWQVENLLHKLFE